MNAPAPSTGLRVTPTKEFSDFMLKMKPQMALALPKHMNPDRMARLALTAFSGSEDMQRCSFRSIASSLMTAGAMGLEPGVNGAGYLIPYKGTCTFVPGWKGLVDLVSRSGRATVWTGAVFDGDEFDYALGDRPFVRHRPGDETDPDKLTHVYAIGRSNGSDYPVIEVWSMAKVWKHRDKMNKQGGKHYSFRNPEMYARKVPLLQVLKYMPTSIEVANAIAVADAAETGRGAVIEGNFVTLAEEPPEAEGTGAAANTDPETGEIREVKAEREKVLPLVSEADFGKKKAGWKGMVESGKKTPNDLIAFIESREALTDDQKVEIASWAVQPSEGQA